MENDSLEMFFHQHLDESIERRKISLSDYGRIYLAKMLCDYAKSDKLFRSYQFDKIKGEGLVPITLQYLSSFNLPNSLKSLKLKELADDCLFLTGFFYDFIRKEGMEQVSYHYNLGSSAYYSLGNIAARNEGNISALFFELSDRFIDLSQIIGDMHLPSLKGEKLLEVYRKWKETKDPRYLSLLMAKNFYPSEGNNWVH